MSPPNPIIEPREHSYWVGYLGSAMAAVSRASTLGEAKKVARLSLMAVTDPIEGPRETDEQTRRSWRTEGARKDDL